MIIKTKSIRDAKKDTDGVRLLVARYPRRVKRTHYDLWYPALAPIFTSEMEKPRNYVGRFRIRIQKRDVPQ